MTDEAATPDVGTDDELEAILDYLKTSRGFDFTGYKRPSLRRRIERRMQVVGVPTFSSYLDYLRRHEAEFADLFNTILINVTSFFRDPPGWAALESEVIPRIVEEGDPTIRLWSAGCATGEEAYSLAILFAEALGLNSYLDRVKVYATDADEAALTEGRHARYTREDVEGVSAEYLARYFDEVNGGYAVKPELRRAVIFGRNDLVSDPPISRVDLILARNTLMYFNAETQRRILGNLHFALKPNGYLFLGKSELLLTRADLFTPLDMRRRIFRRVESADFGESLRRIGRRQHAEQEAQARTDDARMSQATFEAAPVAQLVVDRQGVLAAANIQARSLFGLTQKDLGRAFQDLEVSYRPIDLRSLMDEVRSQRHASSVRDVQWAVGGDIRNFDVQVSALHSSDGGDVGTTIAFLDTTRYRRLQENLEHSKERLETAYEELQSTAEELETTNEELQSTNEELETTNEELHSTNEELETMNEELQSTNEELTTMNDELRERTDDLHQVNTFLESILGSLGPAVAVTDGELRVEAWNERARELWGLSAEEVRGHHLMNLDIGLPLDRVLPVVRSAIAAGDGRHETVVDATNRRGRAIRCHVIAAPLKSGDGEGSGVILLMEEEATD